MTIYAVYNSYAIIVEPPSDGNKMKVIYEVTKVLSIINLIFLSVVTLINFLLERKVEKRKSSKEFIALSLIHLLIFASLIIYCAKDYYDNCCS